VLFAYKSQGQQHAIEDGQRGVGGGMQTARLLTNSSMTQRNILTPERISQGHVQTGSGLLFRGPLCICRQAYIATDQPG
jgi:hypothetical protein